MTDVGPYPTCVSPRSPVTSADISHIPVSLARSARIWLCLRFHVSAVWRFIMFSAGTSRTRACWQAIRAAASANCVS